MNTPKRDISKFLCAFVIVSLIVSLYIERYNILTPCYLAIICSGGSGVFSYLVSKLCLDIGGKKVYKDISLVLGYTGALSIIFTIYNISHDNEFNTYTILFMMFIYIIDAILFCIVISNNKLVINLNRIIFYTSLIWILLSVIIIICDFILNFKTYSNIENIILIILFIALVLNFSSIKFLNSSNINISKESIKELKIIIYLKTCKLLVIIFNSLMSITLGSINIAIIFMLLNITLSFIVISLCIRNIIIIPNESLYKSFIFEKEKLKDYVVEIENMTNEIMTYKNLFYESMKYIPQGIITCRNDKITFINEKVKKYLNVLDIDTLIGTDYEQIVNSRRNKNKTENGLCINDIKILYGGNEFSGEEFNTESTYNDLKLNMIVLKDINEKQNIDELIKIIEQKKAMDLSRNELLSNLSHEFKTPVNIIYSTAQLMEINMNKEDYSKQEEYNNLIKKNCNRLIRLINNFIDSTKFESSIINMDLKVVNIVSIVEDLTMSVINFAKNKRVNITFDTEKEEIYAIVDINFLERIILNLLSNAIKYNKKDGNILVNIKENKSKVEIIVEDSGIGISEDKLEKLFNRFERFNNNNLAHEEGTGIGLNIVKQMVDALDGSIKAKSKKDKGTWICVSLYKCNEEALNEISYYNDIGKKVELELSDI